MEEALTGVVQRLGEALRRLEPPFGPEELDAPVSANEPLDGIPAEYVAFLRLADGASCGTAGEIHLWSADRCLHWDREQYVTGELPGGAEWWFAIGDILQNPVVIERATGQVWWYSNLNIVWYTDVKLTSFAKAADNLVEFINHFILGPGYAEIMEAGSDEPWIRALAR